MPIFYVDGVSGSDNNSGAPQTAVGNGTAATRATNVYTLDGTPNLSSITVNEDTIRINGETSGNGSTGDMFTITAFDDGADTVTVSPTPTGGTSGLTWYIGGEFATIDRAMNSVIANDLVYVKATGTYSETPTIDTAGTSVAPITFEGYTSTPGDNGKVTISGTTYCITATNGYYMFKNFILSGASSHGFNGGNWDVFTFINCEFNSNGGNGCFGDNNYMFINCVAHSNSQTGIDVDGTARFFGCIAYANGFHGLLALSVVVAYRNVCYGHSGSFYNMNCPGASVVVIGNTVDGENDASINGIFTNNPLMNIVDNIVYDCNVGITQSATDELQSVSLHNLVNSNTTDYSSTVGITGIGDVTSAPAFTDEAGDDYTLSEASPAIGAGLTPGGIT